jgi:DNA-binding transcriptional MerR regulator
VRTIRDYNSEGLQPGPGTRGKAATYDEEHLLRLRVIRRLVESRVPLATIRTQLAGLTLDEVKTLLAEEERRAANLERATQTSSAKEYVATLLANARAAQAPPPPEPLSLRAAEAAPARASEAAPAPSTPAPVPPAASPPPPAMQRASMPWQRLELAPGVELHVRADAEGRHRSLIERLLATADRLRAIGQKKPPDPPPR